VWHQACEYIPSIPHLEPLPEEPGNSAFIVVLLETGKPSSVYWTEVQYRRKNLKRSREPLLLPDRINENRSMDFVADQAVNGQKFRMLAVVNVFNRECLAIESGQRLRGDDVVRVLNHVAAERGAPKRVFCIW
jgi:hypothetical protein